MSVSSPFPPALADVPGQQTIIALGEELFGVTLDADSPEPLREWAMLSLIRLHWSDGEELAPKLDAHIESAVRRYMRGRN